MNHFQLIIASLLIQLPILGDAQAQEQQKKHQLSSITERHLGIRYEDSKTTYLEITKVLPLMPVGERNALVVRTLEQVESAEHGIMPGQLKTPRYEQIFVSATSRIDVVLKLQQMIRQAGDDYTSPLALAALNAEHGWLQMVLRNKLAPEDYLSLSRKLNSELLKSMLTDANFQTSYEALSTRDAIKPRTLAYALFVLAVANTCAENSRLCDRALPE